MGHPLIVLRRPLFLVRLASISPGDFVAMGAEVGEGALGPGHGETQALFSARAIGGVLSAFIKSHANIGAEGDLDVDRMFGCEEVRTTVEV